VIFADGVLSRNCQGVDVMLAHNSYGGNIRGRIKTEGSTATAVLYSRQGIYSSSGDEYNKVAKGINLGIEAQFASTSGYGFSSEIPFEDSDIKVVSVFGDGSVPGSALICGAARILPVENKSSRMRLYAKGAGSVIWSFGQGKTATNPFDSVDLDVCGENVYHVTYLEDLYSVCLKKYELRGSLGGKALHFGGGATVSNLIIGPGNLPSI